MGEYQLFLLMVIRRKYRLGMSLGRKIFTSWCPVSESKDPLQPKHLVV
jgi:hypothetical protein